MAPSKRNRKGKGIRQTAQQNSFRIHCFNTNRNHHQTFSVPQQSYFDAPSILTYWWGEHITCLCLMCYLHLLSMLGSLHSLVCLSYTTYQESTHSHFLCCLCQVFGTVCVTEVPYSYYIFSLSLPSVQSLFPSLSPTAACECQQNEWLHEVESKQWHCWCDKGDALWALTLAVTAQQQDSVTSPILLHCQNSCTGCVVQCREHVCKIGKEWAEASSSAVLRTGVSLRLLSWCTLDLQSTTQFSGLVGKCSSVHHVRLVHYIQLSTDTAERQHSNVPLYH